MCNIVGGVEHSCCLVGQERSGNHHRHSSTTISNARSITKPAKVIVVQRHSSVYSEHLAIRLSRLATEKLGKQEALPRDLVYRSYGHYSDSFVMLKSLSDQLASSIVLLRVSMHDQNKGLL